MLNFFHTQNNFIEKSNSIEFSKTNFKNPLFNTLKSQNSNFSTFQESNKMKILKEENLYNIVKLQYTLIYDFLSKINLSYTAEVFNSEIKSIFYPTTPFTNEEISSIIEINKNDSNNQQNTININPFLITLKDTYLYNLIYSKTDLLKEEKEVQANSEISEEKRDVNTSVKKNNYFSSTISNANYMKNIDEKLKEIDKKYDNKISKENLIPQSKITEIKFIQYKKELEKKYKEDLKNEIERIKSVEISKILIEENQKYLNKIEAIRNEYEDNYSLKIKELDEKEKILNDKKNNLDEEYIEKTKELVEKYHQKINNLDEKESNFNKKCMKELNALKEQQKTLDRKERELYILKQDYYKEINKEIETIKTEFKQILKEQIQKLKYDNEQELEKAKNKLKLKGMNYGFNMNILKDLNISKDKEDYFKEVISLKEELSQIKSKIKVNNLVLTDNELQIINNNLNYYEQISNLESKLNEILCKTKFKFYNNLNKKEEEKSLSEIIIKDDKIQKKLDELENEQNELNKLFEKEIKNASEEVEKMSNIKLSTDTLEKIKNENYNIVLFKLAKEKEMNEIYKEQQEEERIRNKIKYINEINENTRKQYEKELYKEKYIIIDKNEMDRYKELYYKLYKQKREQQKIDEINRQKELRRQRELKEKEIKEREEKEKEKRQKSKEKKDDDRNIFAKSFQLPPVRNPKERKSSALDSIGDFILKKELEEKQEKQERPEKSMNVDDEYGSGDFVDISKVENKSKTKSKIDISKKEIASDADLSGRIDMILNETHSEDISESHNKGISDSYNDFETSKALDLKGINTINTEEGKSKINEEENSDEDYKF